jgi:hypothetical protein
LKCNDEGFSATEKRIRLEIWEVSDRLEGLIFRWNWLLSQITIARRLPSQEVVKLMTERKHLTNVLEMTACKIGATSAGYCYCVHTA